MSDPEDHLFGIHSVMAALEAGTALAEVRIARDFHGKRLARVEGEARKRGIRVRHVPREDLDRRAGGGRHQGVVGRVEPVALWGERDLHDHLETLTEAPLLLLLDGVTDPRNLGACLRTADAAGVHAVVAPRDRCAPVNATARKVATGAAETVPVAVVPNLARAMDALKERGIFLLGTSDRAAEPWYSAECTGAIGWVLGAEGEGMRDLTAKKCDALYAIPMAGQVTSLNVSVATGIVLFEAVRQRD
ncbi:23S rRNA (guanosine(2251)-2'-O)-methyltransferase RlmB [Thiohalorhabdus methylotrophus]|uniref:23S rRNA (Guanosine(2251)-2'-O)-methyltransferase RlmB n=1 Tax=Thiohalorhabdus methylotrophus TaxID=3242694 RepID=A0ABV4TYC5_9GAMM